MPDPRAINPRQATDRLAVDYPHVGLFDVETGKLWLARRPARGAPRDAALRVAHARLLLRGSDETSTADKDRFLCYWFHTPQSAVAPSGGGPDQTVPTPAGLTDIGRGSIHGHPINWAQGHLMVRLDPFWSYAARKLLAPSDKANIDRNIEQQYAWAESIFNAYVNAKPPFPLTWHLIGPRPSDSLFDIKRVASGR